MTVKQVLKKLESLGDEKRRAYNEKNGAGKNQFGVKLGDVRKVAKELKKNHELALELWESGNVEARMVATLMLKPKSLSSKQLDKMVREATYTWLADWLNSYIVRGHPDSEALREQWMKDKNPMALRAGWNLTAMRVAKDADGLDLKSLLDRIEKELGKAKPEPQWTMNSTLAEIGINHPKHRKRALAIGEKLGVYRDYPVSKGCTSPFAPIWINEIVSRQG